MSGLFFAKNFHNHDDYSIEHSQNEGRKFSSLEFSLEATKIDSSLLKTFLYKFMNKTLKTFYTICLIASLAASFAYLSEVQKPSEKPFIIVSHFSKKASNKPLVVVPAVVKKNKKQIKKKIIATKSSYNSNKRISFAKPVNKEITIQTVKLSKPSLEASGPKAEIVASNDDSVVNNKELIVHYGYDVNIDSFKTISWANYLEAKNVARNLASFNEGEGPTLEKKEQLEENKLAEIKKEETKLTNQNLEDFVKTVASQKLENTTLNTQSETDLVFYDYSKPEAEDDMAVKLANQMKIEEVKVKKAPEVTVKVVNKEQPKPAIIAAQAEAPSLISDNVMAVVEREMGETPKLAVAKPKLNTHNPPALPGTGYSKILDQLSKKRSATKKVNTQKSGYSKTIVTTYEVSIGEEASESLKGFELSAASDGNERISDNNNGYINVETELASSQGVYRATVLKRGYVRTSMDMALEAGTIEIAIPAITQESMMKFLDQQGINGLGGFLLVDKDRGVESLDLDSEFEAKFDFDENFKLTKDDTSVRYVLFAGVTSGNTLLKLRTVENEYSEKIIHIVEDEILFEALLINAPEKMKITTLERPILSNNPSELNISAENIKYFNRDIKANKLASNLHEIKVPILPLGMRRYIEFSHMDETIYVGVGDNTSVELPSSDFIVNLLEANNMSGMEGKCVIQVNLGKELQNVTVNGESSRGPMALDKFYLEKNGSLSEEETPLSTKVFVLGNHQGIINIKINYQDRTTDYLQTFCSPETYLLEQL